MATRSTFVYSAAAVRRMLGLSPATPIKLREFFNVIWVWVKGQRPTFISKAKMKSHFVEYRKAQAEGLKVIDWYQDPPRFTVTNPDTTSRHLVICLPDRVVCDCEDYHWQIEFFGYGCCKHGYAALAYLGYHSLHEYQADHRPQQPVAHPLTAPQSSPERAVANRSRPQLQQLLAHS